MRTMPRTIATLAAIAGTAASLAACSTPTLTTPAAQVTGSDAAEAWNFYNTEPGMSTTRDAVKSEHLNIGYVATLHVPQSAELGDSLSPTYTAVFDARANDWHVFSITRD